MLRAIQSFDAPGRWVSTGELVAESDPIVKGREELFEAADTVEQATAAPGEKRTVSRGKS